MLRDVDVSEAVTVVEDAATVMVLGVTPRHEQANEYLETLEQTDA